MESLQILALFCLFAHVVWGHGDHGGKPLEFASEIHNKDHILEHLQSVIATKPKDQLSDEELEFHYFKLHDYDNNNKLDGIEIGKALTHYHDDAISDAQKDYSYTDLELANAINDALNDDLNGDGYVEYYEFSLAQKIARSVDPNAFEGAQARGGNSIPSAFNSDKARRILGKDKLPLPVEAGHQGLPNNIPKREEQQGLPQELNDHLAQAKRQQQGPPLF